MSMVRYSYEEMVLLRLLELNSLLPHVGWGIYIQMYIS